MSNFNFVSSITEDNWHALSEANSYEWWYFDAVSVDGRDAVVIIFMDNFIFSPRYNKSCKSGSTSNKKFPALAFCYYRDGKPLYRAINEFQDNDFNSSTKSPICVIGKNNFSYSEQVYSINIDVLCGKDIHLMGEFLFTPSETNLIMSKNPIALNVHFWNLAAPRNEVKGRLIVSQHKKKPDIIHFQGTGYHDHNYDTRWLPETVSDWQWGRAHFEDATAVYYRYREIDNDEEITKLFLVKNQSLKIYDAVKQFNNKRLNKFGITYPKELTFSTDYNLKLHIKQNKVIDASFFYLRFLSQATLDIGDGKIREATAVTEHLAPRALRYRWLDWLTDMRIGRNGKGAFLH